MALDRSAILSRTKGKVERVEVPEWADVIYLREISASEPTISTKTAAP